MSTYFTADCLLNGIYKKQTFKDSETLRSSAKNVPRLCGQWDGVNIVSTINGELNHLLPFTRSWFGFQQAIETTKPPALGLRRPLPCGLSLDR